MSNPFDLVILTVEQRNKVLRALGGDIDPVTAKEYREEAIHILKCLSGHAVSPITEDMRQELIQEEEAIDGKR